MSAAEAFLSKFTFTDENSDLLEMAKAAEAAERYEDMCIFMGKLVENTKDDKRQLSVEERNLLSVAYKNVIGARRAAWRILAPGHVDQNDDDDSSSFPQLNTYKEQIQEELKMCSEQVLKLLNDVLVENCDEDEAKVFYLKMSGDYHRYLAEAVSPDEYGNKAKTDYESAYKIAETALAPTHPVRLGLALNFSVCHYEILKSQEEACKMAKEAFDLAISKLDALKEGDYKDSTLIMQLLRDNLTLWTSQENDDENDMKVEDLDDA